MTVTDEAVEAAAKQVCIGPDESWDDADEHAKDAARHLARTMLEAASPHMLPAPEGVSEAEKRVREAAENEKAHWNFASYYGPAVDVGVEDLRVVLSALSSERERAERAEKERDEARGVVRDTLWMARRYADGRQSYAVGMYNDAAKIAEAGGYAKGEPDGTLYALDGLRPEYQTLETRAQAAEAKVKAAATASQRMASQLETVAHNLRQGFECPDLPAVLDEIAALRWTETQEGE